MAEDEQTLKKDDQIYGQICQRLAEMAKKHSSEGFYAFDDPLEAAIFSVLAEILRKWLGSAHLQRLRIV